MAAIQRKLVHKQFNSPMGLYSPENVKATLTRELKAFGADGIEIDEQITKPLNLDKSAVLRAVEEEEQQIKCGEFFALARQSRSRQRALDVNANALDPPHHALHQQLLDQIKTQYLSHQNDIVIDRDTVLRINRMSTRRHLLKRDHSWPPVEHEEGMVQRGITPSPTHSFEVLREKFNSPTRIVEPTPREQRQQRPWTPKMETALQQQQLNPTPKAKGFSAPETKAADSDLGLVAPKCEYYEQLVQQRPTTPTLETATPPQRPRLKRQSYSLDRGRARKRGIASSCATELPPTKPRNGKRSENKVGNGSSNVTPIVQRRRIQLATELKISYDGDSEEEPKVTKATYDIDLETVPLPATPNEKKTVAAVAAKSLSLPRIVDSLALKQQQQMALALATIGEDASSSHQLAENGRNIPITVQVEPVDRLQAASVQQVYDNACSYLKMTQPSDEGSPAAPATYVSATSGIKLQRQDSAKSNSTANKPASSCIPTPPPLPPPTPVQRAKLRPHVKDPPPAKRRQGGIYSQDVQHEAHKEIAQLEAKYVHIQQSITEHLRQIDAYMENAKTALQRTVQATPVEPIETTKPTKPVTSNTPNESWDMFASRQSPILAVESPLQAILRQIYCRAAGIKVLSKDEHTVTMPAEVLEMPAENVPIVERALEDLHKIAVALDSADEHALLQIEHQTKPIAAKAQHVLIEDEDTTSASLVSVEGEEDFSLDYRHVSDVIANYEQLSNATNRQEPTLSEQELSLLKAKESNEKELRQEQEREEEQKRKEQIERKQEQRQKFKQYLEQAQLLVKRQKQEQDLKEQNLKKEGNEKLQMEEQQMKEKERMKQLEEQINEEQEILRKENENESKKQEEKEIKDLPKKEQEQFTAQARESTQTESSGCAHEITEIQTCHNRSSRCSICGECRDSPHGWGKLTKADQWRFDNLHNELLANYKSTYEVRSPYISRQISWEDAQQQQQQQQQQQPQQVEQKSKDTKAPLQRQRSEIEIVTTTLKPDDAKDWQLSRSPSPSPMRKYPAPLIETAQRCSSPFGLNAVNPRSSPTPTPAPEAKFTYVPQLEGHNIGLLVRTATEPLQLSMSNSSSLLAATPPATPRCNSQPPPFEFLMQHGLGSQLAENSAVSSSQMDLGGEDMLHATRDFSINRSFDNVSPRPYIGIEGAFTYPISATTKVLCSMQRPCVSSSVFVESL